jgi:osmotically-inducible protein OsmY
MKTDSEIQKDVMEELAWEPALNASEIGVAVKNGIVTLTGNVDAYWKKISAESAAKRVLGVKAVAQGIDVKLLGLGIKDDSEIAQVAINALNASSIVPYDKIKVTVEDGWVTLEGEVEWEYQKRSAGTALEILAGVKGITNNIKVMPLASVSEIKEKIKSALKRSATVDSEKINIDIDGKKVTLSGKVSSWAEAKDAETAAWFAPGVDQVTNNLEIDTEIFAY